MKVRVDYSDGNYWLSEYHKGHVEAGMPFVEITDDEWREWRVFCEEAIKWNDFCRELGNEQFEKEHPDATK